MVREACAAGQFYPCEKSALGKMMERFLPRVGEKRHSAKAVVAPHAGYVYSGQTAAYSYAAIKEASCYIILSPNHTGLGAEVSIWPNGEWKTPLGGVMVEEELSSRIASKLGIETDEVAHIGEHSIEVQLPFLQHCFKKQFNIVAITIAEQRLQQLKKIGKALAECCRGKDVALIASSDFSHFVPLDYARKNDMDAIRRIEALDAEGFHTLVEKRKLSICGAAPITAAIHYCRESGLSRGKLLCYDSSATASGDENSVVGYASIEFI